MDGNICIADKMDYNICIGDKIDDNVCNDDGIDGIVCIGDRIHGIICVEWINIIIVLNGDYHDIIRIKYHWIIIKIFVSNAIGSS